MSQWGLLDNENIVNTAVHDVDELEFALPGAQFELARIDRGTDATKFRSRFHRGVSSHEIDIRFSIVGARACSQQVR